MLGVVAVVSAMVSVPALADPLSLQFGDGSSSPRAIGLGDTRTVAVDVVATQEFSGRLIAFTVERPALSVDPLEDAVVSVSPETLELAPGQTGHVMLTLKTAHGAPTMAADFTLRAITSAETTELKVPVKVEPILEIRLYGGDSPETWSMPAQVSLRKHAAGVTLKYLNYDEADEHLVHGQGAIPHGSRRLARAVNGQPVGSYDVRVTNQNATSGKFYCHDHEGDAQGKVIKFNAIQ